MRWGWQGRCGISYHFLHDTQSQVRVGASLSAPWQDNGVRSRENSLLLAFQICSSTPWLLTFGSWHLMCASCPIIVTLTSCTMTLWCWRTASKICKCPSTLWQRGPGSGPSNLMGEPTNSAAMVFGPARLVPICAVTLAGVLLPQVSECPYLDVTRFSRQTCGAEFSSGSVPAVLLQGRAMEPLLLRWRRGSPVAAVHLESGWLDAQRLIAGRLLSLNGRTTSIAHRSLFSASSHCVSCDGLVSWFLACNVQ